MDPPAKKRKVIVENEGAQSHNTDLRSLKVGVLDFISNSSLNVPGLTANGASFHSTKVITVPPK
jgi:hypothetical protein